MNDIYTPSSKIGLPPGTLMHIGDQHESTSYITVCDYSSGHVDKLQITCLEEITHYTNQASVTWVTIEGLGNIELIQQIGETYKIHPLVLEDILNTHQRPKFEEYDHYLYIVLKCLLPEEGDDFSINYEQISLVVLKDLVILFKEKRDNLFDPIYSRINNDTSRLRKSGADYLTYVIMDLIVDQTFIVLDKLDSAILELEEQLLFSQPSQESLNLLQKYKRQIIDLKRFCSPVRELMTSLLRSESDLITENCHVYFMDVADHALRSMEMIESYRDILNGLLDVYITSVSNKMNEVMKVLTIFASIFIPLTFLAGIYGMNFDYMPELKMKWAYPSLWVVFITLPVILIYYFKRKGWL